MGWLENLKAKVGDVKVSVFGAKDVPTRKLHASVLTAIDHSIAYHQDPKYVVPSGKGKGKAPTLVYSINGGMATVHLPYKKTRLKLGRVGNQLTFDASKLDDALQQLRSDVAAGAFDKQISKLNAAGADAETDPAENGVRKTRTRKAKPTT